MTDKTIPPICERLEELAAFSEAANGNHLYGVHPNNAARAFTEARETIIALVSALEAAEAHFGPLKACRWHSRFLPGCEHCQRASGLPSPRRPWEGTAAEGLAGELERLASAWKAANPGDRLKEYGALEDALIDNLPAILSALARTDTAMTLRERALIVAFVRSEASKSSALVAAHHRAVADAIERGAHLNGGAS